MYSFKHQISIFLLSLFVGLQWLPNLFHHSIQKHQTFIAHQIAQAKHYNKLTLSIEEWNACKKINTHEIEFEGKLFDIYTLAFEKDLVQIKGCYDTKEDRIVSQSNNLQKKSQNLEKGNPNLLVLFHEEVSSFSFYHSNESNIFFKSEINAPIACYLIGDSPPPKA